MTEGEQPDPLNPFRRSRMRRKRDDGEEEQRDQRFSSFVPRKYRMRTRAERQRMEQPIAKFGFNDPGVPCGAQLPDGKRCDELVKTGRPTCFSCARRAFELLWRNDVYLRSEIIERVAVEEMERRVAHAEDVKRTEMARTDRQRRLELSEKREQEGVHVVYYVRTAPGRVKIGYTSNLARRLREYRSDPTYLLAVEPGGRDLEQQRHGELKKWRVNQRREDYAEGAEVSARIAAVLAEHGDPTSWVEGEAA